MPVTWQCALPLLVCLAAMVPLRAWAETPIPEGTFYRGFNLNGPSLMIDGTLWEAGDSEWLTSDDARLENQIVPLLQGTTNKVHINCAHGI